MPERKLYASLIGINAYRKAGNLNGCVKDILNFDKLLRALVQSQGGKLAYEPLYLLAPKPAPHADSRSADQIIIERYEQSENVVIEYEEPTFGNISGAAFNHLAQAGGNDICIFYYSGHGSYINAPKEFRGMQNTRFNQTLVCSDSRSGVTRDLIDKEIGYLLYKTLRDKPDVHCLVVMDCCHSGSNTRALLQEIPRFVSARSLPPVRI
ncbi:MAG: caspase family protein [Leadbetterella sp.]|nr:caspase family protein [Leadbetterella sp.]